MTHSKRGLSSSLGLPSICLAGATCAPTPPPTLGCSLRIEVSYAARTAAFLCTIDTASAFTSHALHATLTCAQPTWNILVMIMRSIMALYSDATSCNMEIMNSAHASLLFVQAQYLLPKPLLRMSQSPVQVRLTAIAAFCNVPSMLWDQACHVAEKRSR